MKTQTNLFKESAVDTGQETRKDSANMLANLGAAEEMSAQRTLLERETDPTAHSPASALSK